MLFPGEFVPCGMQLYADLFKENHITGMRLLLLAEEDMRDMGVKSKGHIMHLKARPRMRLLIRTGANRVVVTLTPALSLFDRRKLQS